MMAGQLLSFQSGDLIVDLRAHRVRKNGGTLDLEPKAYRVLVYLIENRDRAVTKEELFQTVWGETFVGDNALTRVIAQLRKELGDNARSPTYIETAPTFGYRFIAPVEEIREPAGGPGSTEIALPQTVRRGTRRLWVAGGVVALMLISLNVWFLLRPSPAGRTDVTVVQITTAAGLDLYPTLSPDGSSMAYSSDRKGSLEIFVRSLARGGAETQLTDDGEQNVQPQWSPDGRHLAFYSQKRNGIRVMPALGGGIQQITEFGSGPVWSPDGERIAFRSQGLYSTSPMDGQPSGPSTLWIVNRDGSGLRQLTRAGAPPGFHSDPAWSQDGRILFSAFERLFKAAIWSVKPDGSDLRRVRIEGPVLSTPLVSPQGTHLIYSSAQGPGSMTVARARLRDAWTAEAPEHLFSSPHSMPRMFSLSSDGRRILFGLSWITSELWSLPMNPGTHLPSGEATALVRNRTIRNSRALVSPDGRQVLYFSRPAGDSGDAWVVPATGGDPRAIPLRSKPEFSATWTPDGQSIVYVSVLDDKRVVCTSALSGHETCVPVGIPLRASTRVSPDGREIAYHLQEPDGSLATFVYELAGGRTRRLSAPGSSVSFPCWSGDQKWLAMEVSQGDGTSLLVMPSRGGTGVPVAQGFRHAWAHTWAPDSDRIAFAGLRDGAWNLWWISRSTGESRMLTHYTKFSDYVRYPAWSPKGDFIVYELARIGGNIYRMELP